METLKEASRSADGNMLFMFYGLLNINKLAEIFKGCFKADSIEAVAADLRSRAVALELDGWGRTFGSKYATIEPIYGAKLRTYGIYLSKQEGYICDQIEGIASGLYDRIILPVKVVKQGQSTDANAYIYRMTSATLHYDKDATPSQTDDYLNQCWLSDLHFYELSGNVAENQVLEIRQIGTNVLVRTYIKQN